MNKKGFTLIELLAVIVILAVILVIAVPKILNVIDESRRGAYKSTNQMIVSAVRRSNQIGSLDPSFEMARTYTFTDGVSDPELELSGKLPTSGSVEVNSEGKIRLRLLNDKYCALKRYEESEVTVFDADDRNCNYVLDVALIVNLGGEGVIHNQDFLPRYMPGTEIDLIDPIREGYTFEWGVSGTGASIINGTPKKLVIGTDTTTLTATWLSYFDMFTYTVGGNPGVSGTDYEIIDDENGNWRIKFLTSGTFTPLTDMTIDIFLVGGGGGGGHATSESYNGAAGGGGGYTNTITSQILITNNNYPIVIGSGGLRGSKGPGTVGGESTFTISELTIHKAEGGNGGTSYWGLMIGGSGGSGGGGDGQAGSAYGTGGTGSGWAATGTGQEETTCEFGMGTTTGCYTGVTGYSNGEVTAYAGGGSGSGNATIPTAGSCGNYGCSPTANSGGGGGGARYYNGAPGVGATGIVIIRNSR